MKCIRKMQNAVIKPRSFEKNSIGNFNMPCLMLAGSTVYFFLIPIFYAFTSVTV